MSQYLEDYVERWGLSSSRTKGDPLLKKKKAVAKRRPKAVVPCKDIRKLMDPEFDDTALVALADATAKPALPGQVETKRVCPAGESHPTECFAAKGSGKLYWRCTECKQPTGQYAGSPVLLGGDGEEPRSSRKRVAPTPVSEVTPPAAVMTAGETEFSLESLERDLRQIKGDQKDILGKLVSLERAFALFNK